MSTSRSSYISNVNILDPIEGQLNNASILIEGGIIKAIGPSSEPAPPNAEPWDAQGKFAIPGLLNANVHLLGDIRLENLARFDGSYEELIVEAAQVALKVGMTTVFDTWGPRKHLVEARERINGGTVEGARIYCAGNIIGFEGPFSIDFIDKAAGVASESFSSKINATWVENVGRHLMWLTPREVGDEVKRYIDRGIDFVKYASNEHFGTSAGAFLEFSPATQEEIVKQAHSAGLTAQAHCMSTEGLRVALDAGADIIQHCNITGPALIPVETLQLITERGTGAVVFPWTRAGLGWIKENVVDLEWTMWSYSDLNVDRLIEQRATILMGNDGVVWAPEMRGDPTFREQWHGAPEDVSLNSLANGHFAWLLAMEEKGLEPLEILKAATLNIARSYNKDHEIGSIAVGKKADLVFLLRSPLEGARNYRTIHAVIKDGRKVDLAALPSKPMLMRDARTEEEEERAYKPFVYTGPRLPGCHLCGRG